jgi:transcriptional regulator with XRE-family HTH domain
LGQHLKKRRRELGLLQREAAERMTVSVDTLINWEKSRTEPMPSQFRPVLAFLGYDPTPAPMTLPERLLTKRRATGMTLADVARNLGWDEGTLTRYLEGAWRMPAARAAAFETLLSATTSERDPIYRLPRRLRTTKS